MNKQLLLTSYEKHMKSLLIQRDNDIAQLLQDQQHEIDIIKSKYGKLILDVVEQYDHSRAHDRVIYEDVLRSMEQN